MKATGGPCCAADSVAPCCCLPLPAFFRTSEKTGTGKIKQRLPGVKSAISRASGAQADVLLEPGDTLHFGRHAITALVRPALRT